MARRLCAPCEGPARRHPAAVVARAEAGVTGGAQRRALVGEPSLVGYAAAGIAVVAEATSPPAAVDAGPVQHVAVARCPHLERGLWQLDTHGGQMADQLAQ